VIQLLFAANNQPAFASLLAPSHVLQYANLLAHQYANLLAHQHADQLAHLHVSQIAKCQYVANILLAVNFAAKMV